MYLNIRDYFFKLINYNQWANELTFRPIVQHELYDEELIRLMSHIVNVEFIWYSRINEEKEFEKPVWHVNSPEELKINSGIIDKLWMDYVRRCRDDEFSFLKSYHNSKGEHFITAASDIILHVMNHSTYHRGQINKLLRQKNIDPVNTDYITYLRKVK
jgi:uncharacterized damage-inducible protein DinB